MLCKHANTLCICQTIYYMFLCMRRLVFIRAVTVLELLLCAVVALLQSTFGICVWSV